MPSAYSILIQSHYWHVARGQVILIDFFNVSNNQRINEFKPVKTIILMGMPFLLMNGFTPHALRKIIPKQAKVKIFGTWMAQAEK